MGGGGEKKKENFNFNRFFPLLSSIWKKKKCQKRGFRKEKIKSIFYFKKGGKESPPIFWGPPPWGKKKGPEWKSGGGFFFWGVGVFFVCLKNEGKIPFPLGEKKFFLIEMGTQSVGLKKKEKKNPPHQFSFLKQFGWVGMFPEKERFSLLV